jgi:hypothetical protein
VKATEILAAHRDSTLERVAAQEIVLAVQDTTELDFSEQPKKQRLGALSKKDAQGLKVHSVLCVSPLGVPLGVLHQKVWAREKIKRTTGYQDRKRAIVAWRLLWLTYEARRHPEQSVEGILETPCWMALYFHIHQTTVPPEAPPSLSDCVRWIARLGGFLGRKSDGDPGVKTLWLGLQRLHDLAAMLQLLRPSLNE